MDDEIFSNLQAANGTSIISKDSYCHVERRRMPESKHTCGSGNTELSKGISAGIGADALLSEFPGAADADQTHARSFDSAG
jgi:hypothetical protein